MKKSLVVVGCIWLFFIGAASALEGQGQAEKPVAVGPVRPLSEVLSSDGTVNLGRGLSGSFDPRGFRMISDPGKPPRFVPESSPLTQGSRPGVAASDEGSWDDRFFISGASDRVNVLVIDGGIIYAGGRFNCMGDVLANKVAKWDGTAWSALGSGTNGEVNSLAVMGTDLYAGGYFTTAGGVAANYIAKWDGTSWSALGSGTDREVYSLAVMGTDLYAGGSFWTAGGVVVNSIAKWDGTSWSELSSGVDSNVYALAVMGTDLYAGGYFWKAGGVVVNRIAKWDGTSWSALGPGIKNSVHALAVSGQDLYAGGGDYWNGGYVSKWNGLSWSDLGTGLQLGIVALAVSGQDIYAGGECSPYSAGASIVKWDGAAWSSIGPSSGSIYALTLSGPDLLAGGAFSMAGGIDANNIARWDKSTWSAIGKTNGFGMNGNVSAIVIAGTDLYAGGSFTTAGGVAANHIAKWDGTTWSALGSGTNNAVWSLAVSGSDLYAGGDFLLAGGITVNHIAKWDGASWSPLGSGISTQPWISVYALAFMGTDLYAGGYGINKWDGTSWSSIGSGSTSGVVWALAVSGSDLYAGGGQHSDGFVSKWDGSNWSDLGSGMNSPVYALAFIGPDLFAGGEFTKAGGVPASGIAMWDGGSWFALDPGTNGLVRSLAVSGSELFMGGDFTTAGGVPANKIAKWDGRSWSGLSSGMNTRVSVLAASASDLYAGGDFVMAGDKVSARIAIWHRNLILTSPCGGEVWEVGATHSITWAAQPTVGDVKLEYSPDGGTNWTTIIASTPNDGSYDWVVPNSPSAACLVRISENVGGGAADVSDAAFWIVSQPTIILISPNGGECWSPGQLHSISWISSLSGGNVKLEYSKDNGTSYATIIASTANTGKYLWTVPNVTSTFCLVRISDAAQGAPADTSDGVFSIASPTIRLSRSSLFFGALVNGWERTRDQFVLVSNSGSGILNWRTASSQSWLSVTPSLGTGTQMLRVNAYPGAYPAGTYTGTITVSDPSATNNPRTVAVTLTVKAAGTGALPFGEFSTPVDGTTGITGAIPITGWVLDDIEVTQVAVKRDPHALDPAGAIGPDGLVFIGYGIFVEGARPDIETGYPAYPLNYRAGWGYMLLTNFLPNQGNGTYKLYAIATDEEGNRVTLGTKTITCANATAVKPFGTIDTPIQGGDASGSVFVNFGWVLTPKPKTVPKDGSTIEVYVDSVKVGDLKTAPNVYNQYRVDVATAFPGLNNSGGPVGAFYLDTSKYANGVHTIHWVAMDDAGSVDGIGSRYFNIVNTGTAGKSAQRSGSGEQIWSGKSGDTDASDVSEFFGAKAVSFSRREDILGLGMTFEPISVRSGFDPRGESRSLIPDNFGVYHVEIPEVNRVEIDLKSGHGLTSGLSDRLRYSGYLIVGEDLRPLPIGSTLDRRAGCFYWMPGPGFLGSYDFGFIEADASGSLRLLKVRMEIRPRR